MGNVRFVGMDVHKESIVIAVAEGGRTPPQVVREIPNDIGLSLATLMGPPLARVMGPGGSMSNRRP